MSDQLGVLEKAANIAVESLKKIEAPVKAKAAEAEAKGAAEQLKADEAKKTEGIKLAKEADDRAKDDERILTVEDKELSGPELERKAELRETKRKKDESPDEKIKRVQESTQKRIDEIKSEQLAKENKNAAELAALKAELEELKKPKQQEDAAIKSKREEAGRIAQYVEEDKSKPRDERREMTKDELDGWYLEDPVEATKWIQRTEYRRLRDKEKSEEANKPDPDKAKKLADEFISKQNESKAKLLKAYPGIMPAPERIKELQTKHNGNLDAINAELRATNAEFKLISEICAEDPKKYIESVDGPELAMAEMEKRLKKPTGKIELTQEELDAKIQAEIERRKHVDGEGITSSTGGKKVDNSNKSKSELRQQQEKIAKKAGISIESLDKAIARRATIPGASAGGEED